MGACLGYVPVGLKDRDGSTANLSGGNLAALLKKLRTSSRDTLTPPLHSSRKSPNTVHVYVALSFPSGLNPPQISRFFHETVT